MWAVETEYPERIVPDQVPPGVLALHLKRYIFASDWCRGKRVLDVACGVGYGSRHLAGTASFVLGGDLSADAIAYARAHYGRLPNLAFAVIDAARIGLPSGSMDVMCSFETIEHLTDPKRFLAEARRVLDLDGVFVVSTPNARTTTSRPDNPFHCYEWCLADFRDLLAGYFLEVKLYGQTKKESVRQRWLKRLDFLNLRTRLAPGLLRLLGRYVTGSRATPDLQLDDVQILTDDFERASEIVAVCRGAVA